MKQIFNLILSVALLFGFVSCQKDNLEEKIEDSGSFTITAEIEDFSTKVTYDVGDTQITPSWTVNTDKIIAFDNDGNTFTFTVTNVDQTGKATLTPDKTPTTGKTLYAVYYPGKEVSAFTGDGVDKTLAVDLSAQSGASLTDNSPVLMCATGTVTATGVNLVFSNQTAIVGIKKFQLLSEGTGQTDKTISSVKVSGLVTSGTFKVVEGEMKLVAGTETNDITVSQLSITSGDGGKTSDALMFATLPTSNASISFVATTSDNTFGSITNLTGDIAAGQCYLATKKLNSPVAKIGETSFYRLSDAFNSVSETATIKIMENCDADATLSVASGKNITLDLNGKTIKVSGNDEKDPQVANRIEVNTGGILTILDSSSDGTASQGSIIAADGTKGTSNVAVLGGTLTINGGNFISSPSESDDIDAAVYAKLGAILTINGGTFTSTSLDEGAVGASSIDNGTITSVTINGGTINGGTDERSRKALHMVRANLTIGNTSDEIAPVIYGDIDMTGATKQNTLAIKEGTFTCASNSVPVLKLENNVTGTISGGTFKATGETDDLKEADLLQLYHSGSAAYPNISISGGLFVTNKLYGFYSGSVSSSVNVTGGYFYATTKDMPFFKAGGYNSIGAYSVTGGYFNRATISKHVGSGSNYKPDNYVAKTNDNTPVTKYINATSTQVSSGGYKFNYTIGNDSNDACIGNNNYSTLSDAISALSLVTAASKLVVLKDVAITAAISYTNSNAINNTIDLNGKTISGSVATLLSVTAGELTVDDNFDGSGCIECSSSDNGTAVLVSNAKFRLEDGTINHTNGGYSKNAIRVEAGNAATYFYMNGGVLTAGTRVLAAKGGSSQYAYVYFNGGTVESTKTITNTPTNGATVRTYGSKVKFYFRGSTIITYKQPAVYFGSENTYAYFDKSAKVSHFYSNDASNCTIFSKSSSMGSYEFSKGCSCYTNCNTVASGINLTCTSCSESFEGKTYTYIFTAPAQ